MTRLSRSALATRIALQVSYSGTPFHGWQRQIATLPTVQQTLEEALGILAGSAVTVYCAGRTDTGVHATKQIVHFDTDLQRPINAWSLGVNAQLPDELSIQWAGEVTPDFDARHSALARRYLYLLHNRRLRSPLMSHYITHYHAPLDTEKMHTAAQHLLGEQDFTSFRGARCQAPSPVRQLQHLNIERHGDLVILDLQANGFLHHMVRNIVGVLMDIGTGKQPVDWMAELLVLKQRSLASRTAAAHGLYLIDVIYPPQHAIPTGPELPHFLSALLSR